VSAPPRRPRIGITTYGPGGRLVAYSLPRDYVDAVRQAGGLPLLLPSTPELAESMLDALDGVIFAGGGDMDPSFYAGGTHPTLYGVSTERDGFELELCRAALRRPSLPVLGICRGMQVLNVALGGDLELHLPDVRGDAVAHRAPPREPTFHPVEVEAGSALEAIYGEREFRVCSWHHQGVRRLGRDLRPIAHAPDGVIEGVLHVARRDTLGIQWHPERQLESDPLQRRIFAWLAERAVAAAAERASGA
jgi:putative glutamine amidotransferase